MMPKPRWTNSSLMSPEDDVVPGFGHHLGDAGTHGAGAHYYDFLDHASAATS